MDTCINDELDTPIVSSDMSSNDEQIKYVLIKSKGKDTLLYSAVSSHWNSGNYEMAKALKRQQEDSKQPSLK